MTKENIHQIINDDENVIGFIYDVLDRQIRIGPPIYYIVYWTYLSILSGNMITNKYELKQEIFDQLNIVLKNDDYIDKLMTVFINDYNNYYLDDYYYNMCWMDCYIDYDKAVLKYEIEEYRCKVVNETYDYIYDKITFS